MRKFMFWRVTDLACTGEGCTGEGAPAKDSPHTAKAPLYVFPSRSWCTGGVPGYEIPCPISHWIPRTLELNITIKGCTGDVPGHIYIYTIWRNMYRGCTRTYIYIPKTNLFKNCTGDVPGHIYIYIYTIWRLLHRTGLYRGTPEFLHVAIYIYIYTACRGLDPNKRIRCSAVQPIKFPRDWCTNSRSCGLND